MIDAAGDSLAKLRQNCTKVGAWLDRQTDGRAFFYCFSDWPCALPLPNPTEFFGALIDFVSPDSRISGENHGNWSAQ